MWIGVISANFNGSEKSENCLFVHLHRTCGNLLLIFYMLGWFLYLLTIYLIGSGSFKESDELGYLNNPRDDVMD